MTKAFNGNNGIATVIIIALICFLILYPLFMMIVIFMQSRSYCEIYENAIAGKTAMSGNDTKSVMEDFEISYNDISSVSQSGKFIIIYTKYANYRVLANNNRDEAARQIRSRLSKDNQ